MNEMDGKDVFNYSFCRKDKVVTLSESSKINCGDKQGKSIDPALLFQRLLVGNAGKDEIKFEEVIGYELSTPFHLHYLKISLYPGRH